MVWPQLREWFPAFLRRTRGALDVAVYHSYNQVHAEALCPASDHSSLSVGTSELVPH